MEWIFGAGVVVALFVLFRRTSRSKPTAQGPEPDLAIDIPIRVTISTHSYVDDGPSAQRDPTNSNLPLYDAWETDMLQGASGQIDVKVDAEISYIDSKSQPSRRRITTKSLVPWEGGHAILAYCHDRKSHRTFVVQRIQEFIDLSTGEIIDDVVGYLANAYASSPEGKVAAVFDRHAAEVTILLFVGRANGSLSPKERITLLNYLQTENPDVEAPTEVWKEAIPAGPHTVRDFKAALKDATLLEELPKRRLMQAIRVMAPLNTNELTKAAASTALAGLGA